MSLNNKKRQVHSLILVVSTQHNNRKVEVRRITAWLEPMFSSTRLYVAPFSVSLIGSLEANATIKRDAHTQLSRKAYREVGTSHDLQH